MSPPTPGTPCGFQQLVQETVSMLQSVYYVPAYPCGFQQLVQETVSMLQSVYYVPAYPLWFSTTCAGNCLYASIRLLCPCLPSVFFNNLWRKLSLCFNPSTMSPPTPGTPCGFQQLVQETVSML